MSEPLTPIAPGVDGASAERIASSIPVVPLDERDGAIASVPSLPSDHPAWPRDVLSVSARARAVVAALRPLVIAVLSFWDHGVREIRIGAQRLGVDASGSYRLR